MRNGEKKKTETEHFSVCERWEERELQNSSPDMRIMKKYLQRQNSFSDTRNMRKTRDRTLLWI